MEHVEPKHKPSPKHTLADVLGSLQDLVRNELADNTPPEPSPSIDTTSQQRGGSKVSANDVLNSLKGLIGDSGDNRPVLAEPTVVTETPAVVQQDPGIDDAEVIEAVAVNEVLEAKPAVEDHDLELSADGLVVEESGSLDDAVAELEAESITFESDTTETTDTEPLPVIAVNEEPGLDSAGIAAPESDHGEIRLDLDTTATAENAAVETPALFAGEQLEVDFDVDREDITADEPPADPDAPAIMPNLDFIKDDNNEHARMALEPLNLDDNPFLSKEEPPSGDEDTITLEVTDETAEPELATTVRTDRNDTKADSAPPTLRLEDEVKLDDGVPPGVKPSKPAAKAGKGDKPKTRVKQKPAQKKKIVAKEAPAPLIPDVTDPEPEMNKAKPVKQAKTAKQKKGKKPAAKSQKAGSKAAKMNRTADSQTDVDWDDIPVLDNIAKEPATTPVAKTKTVGKIPDKAADKTLAKQSPSQKSAVKKGGGEKKMRDIAIKAIAKLNIQLRKSGQASLEPIMIDRLQYVLKELLDQQGTNVDNTPQKAKKSRKSK